MANHSVDIYALLQHTQRQRVSDGTTVPILTPNGARQLVILWPQLGDFDSLEYAWWLQRERDRLQQSGIMVSAVGIGDRGSGKQFCQYTGFPPEQLFVDPNAALHQDLGLYEGLSATVGGLKPGQNAWLNLMLMCAGIGSPGTLAEVFRGYRGDRKAPQLIADDETIHARPLPPFEGKFFRLAGGNGFQRPFELATLRLRNMAEVLGNWSTYVPNAAHLTQRGGTFWFDAQGSLLYEHRDRGILGFAENMSCPLGFVDSPSCHDSDRHESDRGSASPAT